MYSTILEWKFTCVFIQFKILSFNFTPLKNAFLISSFKHKISGCYGKKTEKSKRNITSDYRKSQNVKILIFFLKDKKSDFPLHVTQH